jgi:hypothetical protein
LTALSRQVSHRRICEDSCARAAELPSKKPATTVANAILINDF